MFFPKAVFCRVFQAAFRMALPVLPSRQPRILTACARWGRESGEKRPAPCWWLRTRGSSATAW